jgi:tetratricopeptide (TPR) repeat protein
VSLLLEALKKAELAKQQGAGGQPPAEGAPAAGEPGSGLSLEPLGGASAGQPLMTRDRLPDITQPLEIFTEDLAASEGPKEAAATPSPAAVPVRPTSGRSAASSENSPAAASEEAERASARQLFESKAGEYAPRRIFPLIVGALGVVVLGVVGYFAYQVLAPRPSFYTGPPGGKAPPPAAAATAPAQPTSPVASAPGPASASAPAIAAAPAAAAQDPTPPAQAQASSGTIVAPPQPTPAAGSVQRPTTVAQATRAPVAAAPAAEPRAPRSASAPRAPVQVTTSGPRVDPSVERGWEALQAGDLGRAAEEYNRALRANPTDRDALLGLAAIDTRTQNFERAEARYLKVLELDPRDAYANAALIGLRGGADAQQAESRLKTLLAQQPDANLSFALGNQYASQGRWAEAQQAYFAAFTGEPENADYAYNLAVSLDQMRQSRLALDYYQRALKLAGNRPVGFNTAQVETRVRDLQR